jgi:hypothetical protein
MIVSLQNTTAQQKQLKFISNSLLTGLRTHSLPKRQTETAQTIIAMIAPLDSSIDPELGPDAPASVSPVLVPADDPTSPADGPGQVLAV